MTHIQKTQQKSKVKLTEVYSEKNDQDDSAKEEMTPKWKWKTTVLWEPHHDLTSRVHQAQILNQSSFPFADTEKYNDMERMSQNN